MFKRLFLNFVFYLYRNESNKPLSAIEIKELIKKLATTPGLESFPRYLDQCADNARNKYLYSNDLILKGTILAFVALRDKIVKEIPKKKKNLTREEKNAIMRGRGY